MDVIVEGVYNPNVSDSEFSAPTIGDEESIEFPNGYPIEGLHLMRYTRVGVGEDGVLGFDMEHIDDRCPNPACHKFEV